MAATIAFFRRRSLVPHLHGELLHVHERLDVLFRDVLPGHGGEAGPGLPFEARLPAEACSGDNERGHPGVSRRGGRASTPESSHK